MKKKLAMVFLTASLGAAVLAGCGSENAKETKEETKKTEDSSEEKKEKKDEDSKKETDSKEEKSEGTENSSDIKPVETAIDSPAKIGEWVETKRYSATDQKDHTVYYRITEVVRDAKEEVDAYNASDSVVKLSDLENDDLEYCMIKYEVSFPKDFPQEDYGITSVDVDFSVTNPEGGGIEANGLSYIGLSTVWDISDKPDINEFYAGETFTEGKAIFAMVKGVSDYVFETTYYDENDEAVSSYVEGK